MPTLEELNKLKNRINEFGDEPRLLAKRGESLLDVQPPSSLVDYEPEQIQDSSSGGGIEEMEALLGAFSQEIEDDVSGEDSVSALEEELGDFSLDDMDFQDLADESPPEDFGFGEESSEFPMDEQPAKEPGVEYLDLEPPPEEPLAEMSGEETSINEQDDIENLEIVLEPEEDEESELVEELEEEFGDTGFPEETGEELSLNEELNLSDELSLDEELSLEEVDESPIGDDDILGVEAPADIAEVEFQQFSMEDFGEEYNFTESDEKFAEALAVNLDDIEESLDAAVIEGPQPFEIHEEEFLRLTETLGTLPRSLRLAIEEALVDERWSAEVLKPLIDALIDGESPKSLAGHFYKITKRKIVLPRGYGKRSGSALEVRRASLPYQLAIQGWPVVRVIIVVAAVAWGLVFSSFMWIYRPLKAGQLYEAGLKAIAVDDVDESVQYFHDAWDGWPLFLGDDDFGDRIADAPVVVKGWKSHGRWLEYAHAFRRRKHWSMAERFYAGYLAVRPEARDVRLEFAEFLSGVMGQYEAAVEVLESAPKGRRKWDRDLTLAAGHVYLDWAEDDPTKYEDARFHYAKVLEASRDDEQAILSMMRYHLRLRNSKEIDILLPVFADEVPGKTAAPELASEVYSEIGLYHLERGRTHESRRFINLAMAADPMAPEPAFADAVYWKAAGEEPRELNAYERALVNLEGRESLARRDLRIRILSLGGMGRIYANRARRLTTAPVLMAESRILAVGSYEEALDLYEDALSRNQLGIAPEYGQLYLESGDIFYDGIPGRDDLVFSLLTEPENLEETERFDELLRALQHYNRAEEIFDRGRRLPRLPEYALYRRAYARYVLGRNGFLVDFHRTARRRPEDYEARLALGTALLVGGDYEASRSQYMRSIDLLDEELRRMGGVLEPRESQGHQELLLRYVVAWNNLGIARARSAARGGAGQDDYAAALGAFTMASEYLDEAMGSIPELQARGFPILRDEEARRIIVRSVADERTLLKETGTIPYRNRLRLLDLEKPEVSEGEYMMYFDIPSDILEGPSL